MEKGFLKEKLKFERKRRQKGDLLLKIAVITIFSGYLIFFLSGYLFPSPKKDIVSFKIGDSLTLENYVLTLDAWDYAEDDKTFEIIFSVDDFAIDKKMNIEFSLREKNSIYDAEVYKKIGEDMIVVRAKGIPKDFFTIFLTAEANSKSGYLQISKENIKKVQKLKQRSEKEYMIYAIESKLEGLEEHKQKARRELKKMETQSITAYDKLEKLDKKKENQTEAEIKKTDENMSKLSLEIGNLKSDMDLKVIEIEELKAKISKQKQLLNSLK